MSQSIGFPRRERLPSWDGEAGANPARARRCDRPEARASAATAGNRGKAVRESSRAVSQKTGLSLLALGYFGRKDSPMHIMEGYLPVAHAAGWGLASGTILAYCTWSVHRDLRRRPQDRFLLAASAAYMFTLSALKLPSLTGSCSHPTGVGL